MSEFPDSTSAFTGTDIVPDPEVGDPPDGGIKRVPPLAIGNEVGLGVGEPPGYGGGCIPSAGGHKRVPFLAIANKLSLEVGEPPGYDGGYTSSVFGLKADPKEGEPPGNGPTPLLPDCGLCTTPSSGFSSKNGSGA